MSAMMPRLEFRVPIAPTRSFYDRVHFFCAALRRLGGRYADSLVRITVGGDADITEIQAANRWSINYPVQWHRVPEELFRGHGYFATSDFRFLVPETGADLIVLADADTALIRPFGEEFDWMLSEAPCISGHMAHVAPPVRLKNRPNVPSNELWRFLFREFAIPWPAELYNYSRDPTGDFPSVPAYYNFGLVVLNRPALRIFQQAVFPTRDRLNVLFTSEMRCQIACTLISYQYDLRRRNLSAAFNASNDMKHLAHNGISVEQIRLIHYLRRDEVDRETFLSPEVRDCFLKAQLQNPVNQLLQELAREIIDHDWETSASSSLSANHAHL